MGHIFLSLNSLFRNKSPPIHVFLDPQPLSQPPLPGQPCPPHPDITHQEWSQIFPTPHELWQWVPSINGSWVFSSGFCGPSLTTGLLWSRGSRSGSEWWASPPLVAGVLTPSPLPPRGLVIAFESRDLLVSFLSFLLPDYATLNEEICFVWRNQKYSFEKLSDLSKFTEVLVMDWGFELSFSTSPLVSNTQCFLRAHWVAPTALWAPGGQGPCLI